MEDFLHRWTRKQVEICGNETLGIESHLDNSDLPGMFRICFFRPDDSLSHLTSVFILSQKKADIDLRIRLLCGILDM